MSQKSLEELKKERTFIEGDVVSLLLRYGSFILNNETMQLEKDFIQHGNTTTYEHSVNVTLTALLYAKQHHKKVHVESLIVGSLLHDYFLYDWHIKPHPKHHVTKHGQYALKNATRDFGELNIIEKDMIRKHMFPIGPWFPFIRETRILSMADKKATHGEMYQKSSYLAEEREAIFAALAK